MPLLAATATARPGLTPLGWLVVTVGLLLALGGYLLACRIWPFKACRRCDGNGKLRSPRKKAWRICPRCKGNGRRLRFGRRVWNLVTQTSREASK